MPSFTRLTSRFELRVSTWGLVRTRFGLKFGSWLDAGQRLAVAIRVLLVHLVLQVLAVLVAYRSIRPERGLATVSRRALWAAVLALALVLLCRHDADDLCVIGLMAMDLFRKRIFCVIYCAVGLACICLVLALVLLVILLVHGLLGCCGV